MVLLNRISNFYVAYIHCVIWLFFIFFFLLCSVNNFHPDGHRLVKSESISTNLISSHHLCIKLET